jgi:hypothetical protein
VPTGEHTTKPVVAVGVLHQPAFPSAWFQLADVMMLSAGILLLIDTGFGTAPVMHAMHLVPHVKPVYNISVPIYADNTHVSLRP